MNDRAASNLDRLNALVAGGWLALLKDLELRVWLVYLKHADADGVAWPASDSMGRLLGHTNGAHVRRARKGLIDHGLLVKLAERSGPGGKIVAPYRLAVPTPCDSCTSAKLALPNKQSELGSLPSAESARGEIGTSADSARLPSADLERQLVRDPHIEQTKEQTKEQTNIGGAADGVLFEGTNPNTRTPEQIGKRHATGKASGLDRVLIPLTLQTPAFGKALAVWKDYRGKGLKPQTLELQLGKLAKMGEPRAIAAIYHTIERGWTGLREPESTNGHHVGNGRAAVAAGGRHFTLDGEGSR